MLVPTLASSPESEPESMDSPLISVCAVGGNAVSAFLSWRLQATNACDVTLVWKSGFEHVSQYGISMRYVDENLYTFDAMLGSVQTAHRRPSLSTGPASTATSDSNHGTVRALHDVVLLAPFPQPELAHPMRAPPVTASPLRHAGR